MNPDRETKGGASPPHAPLLVLTRNFPPTIGGIERVVAEAVRALSLDFEVNVIGPKGAGRQGDGFDYRGIAPQPKSAFFAVSAIQAVQTAGRLRPAWVLAGSGAMAPAAFGAARRAGCPAWAFVHGLDVATHHPVYRSFFVPALRRLDGVIANSRATALAAGRLGAAGGNIVCIHPGVDLPVLPASEERIRFRQTHGLPEDARILLFVGRLTSRKGLAPFIEQALVPLVAAEPRAHLVIVGAPPILALGKGAETQADLLQRAVRQGLAGRVHFVGTLTGVPLSLAYAAADVHIFPAIERPGDLEGFGLVALEAAAHGLLTVAFATGGIPDAVSVPASGRLVPPGDYDGLVHEILKVLSQPLGSSMTACRKFAEAHSWARFRSEVADLAAAHSRLSG